MPTPWRRPMTVPAYGYRAYGLRIRSAVALPFDSPPGSAASEPDVVVRLGGVPATLPAGGEPIRIARWQARPGAFRMHMDDLARCLVVRGRDILIEPLGDGDGDFAGFFVRSPFTVLLQQRGVLTLHAAAVEIGAGAALLLDPSGAGKSSLAAALVERGCSLLADDLTGVALDAGERPVALPGFSHQRLEAHTLDRMRWRRRAQSRVGRGVEKYWTPAPRVCAEPLPVCAVFVLEADDRPDVGIEPLPPGRAFRALWEHTRRRRVMHAMGRRLAHFRAVTAMVRHVPVARVVRPRHPFLLEALAERIETHLHAAGPGAEGAGGTRGRRGRVPRSR